MLVGGHQRGELHRGDAEFRGFLHEQGHGHLLQPADVVSRLGVDKGSRVGALDHGATVAAPTVCGAVRKGKPGQGDRILWAAQGTPLALDHLPRSAA